LSVLFKNIVFCLFLLIWCQYFHVFFWQLENY